MIQDLDPEAGTLEGYLFPETYLLPRDATAADLVEAMVAQFRRSLSEAVRAEAARQERSVRDVVTLASLIQKETGSVDEHRLVSAVYNNRLRIGMALQCDPTVIYALQLDGLYDGNLTRENLRHDSPYNTYRYPGLPPDRSPHLVWGRSRPQLIPRTSRICTLSAGMMGHMSSPTPCGNTSATCSGIRWSTSERGEESNAGRHDSSRGVRRSAPTCPA